MTGYRNQTRLKGELLIGGTGNDTLIASMNDTLSGYDSLVGRDPLFDDGNEALIGGKGYDNLIFGDGDGALFDQNILFDVRTANVVPVMDEGMFGSARGDRAGREHRRRGGESGQETVR